MELPIYILFNHCGHFQTPDHMLLHPLQNKQEIYCLPVTIPVFVFVCGILCCLLCQNPALTVTFKCTSYPLLFTDLFWELNPLLIFLIHFATPFFSSATVEAIEADEGKLARSLSVVVTTDKGSAGCIHFCCSLYRVCGCWANNCGSVLT